MQSRDMVKMSAPIEERFLKSWKSSVNPDLTKERLTKSFNILELTHILDGGKRKTQRRKELENILFSDPLFDVKDRPFLSKSEEYENALQKSIRVHQLKEKYSWTDEDEDFIISISTFGLTTGVHELMFIPGIERLGTEEQKKKWLPPAHSKRIIGTYAQTELGHGSNLMALETTATFDPGTDEFIMNTPKLTSIKWWPSLLGSTCTHAIVLAQLVIGNKSYGLQAFVVQIRSLEDHSLMPGVKAGSIGPRLEWNFSNSGFLSMDNVRIPRDNMLMRNSKVTRDGKFIPVHSSKANYATMIYVRVNFTRWAFELLKMSATIAVRYSAVRRQSSLKPGGEEQQVLDYQTQQYKVFPALASAYAFFFVHQGIMTSYLEIYSQIMKGDYSKLQELHAQSSGMKAFTSDLCFNEIETCRRACGGHGFLTVAGLSRYMLMSLIMVTGEGENTILYLQTARYLMKQMASVNMGGSAEGVTGYFSRNLQTYRCPVHNVQDCSDLDKLCEIYIHRAHRTVYEVALQMQSEAGKGQEQHVIANSNLVALVRAAHAHSHMSAVQYFVDGIKQLQTSATSPDIISVLSDLCCLFAVHGIVIHSGEFLKTQALGLTELDWFTSEEMRLLAKIRPNAVALVDAFDCHDKTLASALGAYDGNVYQHLYESALRDPSNQTEVSPVYEKILKDVIKGVPSKL